ncbi:MAG: TraB/GumN family protein [Spirochaetota bacterium]|nr:TraB/GumN family protein [Spirochaetota bacterium]
MLLTISIILIFTQGFTKVSKSFLWKTQHNKATVYFFGSVHIGKSNMYPLNPVIEKAFNQSEVLVVEVNIEKLNMFERLKLTQKAMYPENDSIENHVSKETYELTKSTLSDLGINISTMKKFKPWFLAVTVSIIKMQKIGFSTSHGVDRSILLKAFDKKNNGRKMDILQLETAEEQMNIFNQFSDKLQEKFLYYSIKDLNSLEDQMNQLIKSWRTGDIKTFESMFMKNTINHKELKPIYDKLLIERNIKMTKKIESYLKTNRTYFIVVGAGHLVGDKSIIDLLRKKGYVVKQL